MRPRTFRLALLGLTTCLSTAMPPARSIPASSSPAPTPAAPISPDRPGYTNSSDTVDPGRVVIEMGAAQTRPAGGGVTDDFPEAEVRVGLGPDLEAEVFAPDYFAVHHGARGPGDALLGGKWRFYKNRSGSVRASLAPYLSLPTHGPFSSGRVDPSLILGAETASGSRWDIQGNLDLSEPTQADGHRLPTVTPAGAVSYQLTSTLAAFGDAYDITPRRGPSAPTVDGGLTYLLTNDVQLDAEAGVGLGGAAPTRFFGGGVSFRF